MYRNDNDTSPAFRGWIHRTAAATAIAVGTIGALAVLWYTAHVWLLIFAGILLAILLRGISNWLHRKTSLGQGWSLVVVIVCAIVLVIGAFWLLAPQVSAQVNQLAQQLPESFRRIRMYLVQTGWGRNLIEQLPQKGGQLMPGSQTLVSQVTGVFSAALDWITGALIIFFVAVYTAAQPHLYIGGFVRLVPVARRERAQAVLRALEVSLRWWLIGRLLNMSIIAVFTSVCLWLLGIPLALTLGLLAGLLAFVPYVGAVISAVPAILLALLQSPVEVIYVIALYTMVHILDGYILSPLIQERIVQIAPGLTISAQILLTTLLGGLGLTLATPLTVAAMVLVQMLYIEDTLGDRSIRQVRPDHKAG